MHPEMCAKHARAVHLLALSSKSANKRNVILSVSEWRSAVLISLKPAWGARHTYERKTPTRMPKFKSISAAITSTKNAESLMQPTS